MASRQFSASALIQAPPHVVYAIIADYHQGHVQILPKPPFVSLIVEQGGVGSGTVFRASLRALGRIQSFRGVVSEPEPGRVLIETNDNGYVTTFTVESSGDGQSANVTIATELPDRVGITAAVERWLTTRLLGPVYVKELAQLAAVAAERAVQG